MKKNIYVSIALIFMLTISKAQIPNFSFESWTNMGSYFNPDQWSTMNNMTAASGVFTATKATPGNPGSAYLKLTSKTVGSSVVNGIAVSGVLDTITMQPVSGFAFSSRPASISGKWQHMIYGTSQGSISVKLTKWNTGTNMRETVATANITLSGMAMSWASFTKTFTYLTGDNPDSCIIVLKASGANPTDQDYLWVDNLAFVGTVTGIKENNTLLNSISVFPNPASTTLIVDFNSTSSQQTTIQLSDLNGKVVLSKNVELLNSASKQTIDVSGLAKATYFVTIITDKGTAVRRVVLQ